MDLSALAANAVFYAEQGGQPEEILGGPESGCGYVMAFSRAGRCGRALYDASHCFWHSLNLQKHLPAEVLKYFGQNVDLGMALEAEVKAGRSLEGIRLTHANLGGNMTLKGADFRGADFRFGSFQATSFSYCDLSDCVLAGTNLIATKLSNCTLENANFTRAKLFLVKLRDNDLSTCKGLRRNNFLGFYGRIVPVYRILELYPDQAEPMYLELTRYFTARGLYDDASWSAYRAGVLRHQLIAKRFNWKNIRSESTVAKFMPMLAEPAPGPLIQWIYAMTAWLRSAFSLLVIGFGERPLRVIAWGLASILSYAIVYMLPGGPGARSFATSLYFSIVTFTTLGYGDVVPKNGFRLVAGAEALTGILLVGLFIFCLGRRTVSRV